MFAKVILICMFFEIEKYNFLKIVLVNDIKKKAMKKFNFLQQKYKYFQTTLSCMNECINYNFIFSTFVTSGLTFFFKSFLSSTSQMNV